MSDLVDSPRRSVLPSDRICPRSFAANRDTYYGLIVYVAEPRGDIYVTRHSRATVGGAIQNL